MSLSNSRDQQSSRQDGLSAAPAAAPSTTSTDELTKPPSQPRQQQDPTQRSSPDNPSFTSFPEGEGATNPDIPSEPMLNKLYNKVLSLASSAKSPTPPSAQQQPLPQVLPDAKIKTQDSGAGLGISLGGTQLIDPSSVSQIESTSDLKPVQQQHQPQETGSNRQSMIKPVERSPDVLEPVVSAVHAVGGLSRSEDEYSNVDSEKAATEATKQSTKSNRKEINLPGLAGFRLTREPSSDSESVASYSVHPGRTLKSIIGRLKTGDLGREFWMKDETSHECFLCGEKFTTFRRKHHCRICGRIFDDDCTSYVPGGRFGLQEKIRVCKTCKNLMDEYDDLEAQDSSIPNPLAFLIKDEPPPVSLSVIPPSESQTENGRSSPSQSSPQIAYTLPTGRRPGTVPQMAIPATRTAVGSSGRHTAVELPTIDTELSRPQSSRSNAGIQIGRRRSTSFGRGKAGSIPQEEAYSHAPFHQNNMNDDEMLSHDAPGQPEDPLDDFSVDESYAPRSARREGPDSGLDSFQDHLKPPTPVQRHRSLTKSAFDDRLRSSKRRSLQNITRRARSKSRGHRGSSSITGDYFSRETNLSPTSPIAPAGTQPFMPPASPATPGDLNQTSISHLQKLLSQMLVDEDVPNVETWQRVLMPILLKIADTLDPDVRGMGDDIDVRSYVKIKRLPGGTEADSTYVSGVVFTKNLALRRMNRTIANPRVMLVTFPVEYHHSEMQLMSLDPMIAQGKEYIHNLVLRIVSHKPSVLVIGNSVSGVALDYLLQYGISTLYNVKPSVIGALSRCCEADIISSIDKLSSNPELGTCGQFSVRSSVHDLIPGRKKTLVYLNGCPEDLGCTVVLRGSDMQTLSRVKRVLDFMIYVAYNLKLETSLMYDNMINLPSSQDETEETTKEKAGELPEETDNSVYDNVIRSLEKIILSASPCVKFPAPELLLKARDAEIVANKLRREHEKAQEKGQETTKTEEETTNEPESTSTTADDEKDVSEKSDTAPAPPIDVSQTSYQRRVENLLHEYRHNRAINELGQRHKQWENFKQQNPELMNPLAHQNIILLYSNLQKKTSVPCQGPDIHTIDFYQDSDCTLGQYVEDLFMHKEVPCDECEKMQYEHVRNYVHNNGRMNVFIEKLPCPLPGMQQSILMWSWCSVCELTLNVSRMSENSYRYSFGKWLELAFYAKGLKHRGGLCPHDVNRHHVRYFGYDNWVVRFQYDAVDVLNIVVPDMRLTWEPEGDVRLKAEEKEAIATKIDRFYDSVNERLKTISMDNITVEKQEACKAEVTQGQNMVQSQREAALENLERIWNESMVLDRLPLNRILRDLQEHVVYWDAQFAEFEKNYMPSDKDIRRLTAMQLRKLVGDANIPFMDVLEKRTSVTSVDGQSIDTKSTGDNMAPDKPKDAEVVPEATSPPEVAEPILEPTSSEAIDFRSQKDEPSKSSSPLPSSVDSHISDISANLERRTGSAPKTLSVAPKIARLQAEIISPATSPLRKPLPKSSTSASLSSQSPPESRTRNLSAQSSESDEGNSLTDVRRGTPRPSVPPSKIPKPKPPQPLTVIHHGKQKSTDTSESRHKSRNPSEDTTRSKTQKQFVSNTIKKLQRAAGTSSSVSSLAKHFDELSRQYEKEEIKRRKRFGYRRAFPVTSAKPRVEVFSNVQDAVSETWDDEPTPELDAASVGHSRKSTLKGPEDIPMESLRDQQKSDGASVLSADSDAQKADRPAGATTEDISVGPTEAIRDIVSEITESQEGSKIRPEEIPGVVLPSEETKESISLMRAISSLWADRSAALWKPLEYPLHPSAHIFSDSDVIVREDEPSSLIAFTLSSQDYEAKLKTIKISEHPPAAPSPSRIEGTPDTSKPCSRDGDKDQLSQGPQTPTLPPSNDIEAALLRPTGTHMKYQFQEGSANFFCKIFYAEQFDALRTNCGCDEHYIQSLSRCLKWDSSGGKSKSAFLKTLDNRLVLKQMSRNEMDAFVKLAPFYFEYMSQAFFHELPTVLAKILGFYQIGSKNPVTGKTMKMDVLVMENLFYERKTTRIFDLKGSMRNRHVQSTGKENEVLLDENLVEFIYESPLFVGQHSKRILRHSLWNDTLLLAKMNVMDYSLVIGIDEEKKEIILGIIDFIRTFTWDKKLESWVKERGLVGGGTKEPTIVTPRQYKNRFRASMERYFLQVPNCYSIQDTRRA